MDKWLKFIGEFPGNLLVTVPTGIIMTKFLPISYVYQETPKIINPYTEQAHREETYQLVVRLENY